MASGSTAQEEEVPMAIECPNVRFKRGSVSLACFETRLASAQPCQPWPVPASINTIDLLLCIASLAAGDSCGGHRWYSSSMSIQG